MRSPCKALRMGLEDHSQKKPKWSWLPVAGFSGVEATLKLDDPPVIMAYPINAEIAEIGC